MTPLTLPPALALARKQAGVFSALGTGLRAAAPAAKAVAQPVASALKAAPQAVKQVAAPAVQAVKAAPQAVKQVAAPVAKPVGQYAKGVGGRFLNDVQGGFSAADTAASAATPGLLGRYYRASPYLNVLNAPRALGWAASQPFKGVAAVAPQVGAWAGRRLGGAAPEAGAALGRAIGSGVGAVAQGAGQAAQGLGRAGSYVTNALGYAGPATLIPGSGAGAGVARSALGAAAMVPTVAGGAYVADAQMRKHLPFGLLGRGGRRAARTVAGVPTTPAQLMDLNLPGKGTAVTAATQGPEAAAAPVGASVTGELERTMPMAVPGADKPDLADYLYGQASPTAVAGG